MDVVDGRIVAGKLFKHPHVLLVCIDVGVGAEITLEDAEAELGEGGLGPEPERFTVRPV